MAKVIAIMLNNVLTIFLLTASFNCYAGSTFLSDLIDSTYDFHPHALSKQEQQGKSKVLDIFWREIKSNQGKYLPMLRDELDNSDHFPYFYFDGGMLLLDTTEVKSDRILFLRNVPKVNLKDIDDTRYLRIIFDLGKKGYDTSDAALHLLSDPNFKAFIPQHALTLGPGWSLNILLIPQKEELFLRKVINQLRREKTNPRNIHLIYVLWYADTPEALLNLQYIAEDSVYPAEISKTAKELIEIDARILSDLTDAATAKMYESLGIPPNLNYSQLKETRRKRFSHISDENLLDYRKINSLMKRKRIVLKRLKLI